MKSACQLALPGYVFSIICLIPGFVFCIMNKNKLPEICASHFNIHNVPDSYMSREGFFWMTLLYPIGMTLFFDLLGLIFLCLPLNAYNGLNKDYYRKNNRFNMLKSMAMNMMAILGSLTAIFLFSIFEPNYEYNMKCEINPEHPVPCDYKLIVWPQAVVYIVLMVTTIIVFLVAISKRSIKDGLTTPEEESYWKCGACYINMDDDRVCVPKRSGMGYTVNLGNTCGISTMIAIILIPIVIVALILLFQ